jgi:hypothetical protein
MDHRKFDRLTRLFGVSSSRRTALRALLGAVLLGSTTQPAAATPCGTGKHDVCGNGRDNCCPGRCFVHEPCENIQLCCTGPDLIICGGDECCKARDERGAPISDPCRDCKLPDLPRAEICTDYVGGSYRRR